MTILTVPIADFRANLKKYADMLRAGNLEILVTNHGKAILRCLVPEDVLPEVENPPGVHAELVGRLMNGGEGPFAASGSPLAILAGWEPARSAAHTFGVDPVPSTPVATAPRKRTPRPPPPPKEPKIPGPADLARLIGWPKSAFPVNFQKPRPGKGDDWTLFGQAGHKRVWPGLDKMEKAEALAWCLMAAKTGGEE